MATKSLSSAENVLLPVFGQFLPESSRIEGKEVNRMKKMTKILNKKGQKFELKTCIENLLRKQSKRQNL